MDSITVSGITYFKLEASKVVAKSRYLFKDNYHAGIYEATIEEISPSGKNIKIKRCENEIWLPESGFPYVVELLETSCLKTRQPAKLTFRVGSADLIRDFISSEEASQDIVNHLTRKPFSY